jgi:hypothetical protein
MDSELDGKDDGSIDGNGTEDEGGDEWGTLLFGRETRIAVPDRRWVSVRRAVELVVEVDELGSKSGWAGGVVGGSAPVLTRPGLEGRELRGVGMREVHKVVEGSDFGLGSWGTGGVAVAVEPWVYRGDGKGLLGRESTLELLEAFDPEDEFRDSGMPNSVIFLFGADDGS